MAAKRDIDIAKDIVEKYETKEIISFVTKKLRYYNRKGTEKDYNTQDPELQLYIDILIALDNKLSSATNSSMLQ